MSTRVGKFEWGAITSQGILHNRTGKGVQSSCPYWKAKIDYRVCATKYRIATGISVVLLLISSSSFCACIDNCPEEHRWNLSKRIVSTRLTHRPDDGDSKHLWNVCQFLPDFTAQHPRRPPSSGQYVRLGHDRFLTYPFPFIAHKSYHSTLHSLSCWQRH
jgi:hypothetical protein